MIKNGQHIKILFRNGLVEEGVVIEWTGKQAVIKSLNSEDLLVIQNTEMDVQAVKIHVEGPVKKQPVFIDEEVELDEPVRDPYLRAKSLTELKLLRAKEEREKARALMNTHHISNSNPNITYGIPRFQKPPNNNTR